MKFSYKKTTSQGVQEGVIVADSKATAIEKIQATGDKVISIIEVRASNDLHIPFIENILNRVTLEDKVVFAKNLEGMIRAGVPLYRGLSVLEKQTKNKKLKEIIGVLIQDINKGLSLSQGLAKFESTFGTLFIAMVRAGEESGNLAGTLREISFNMDKVYKLRKKVKSAMMYPMVILGAIVLVGILMFIYVVPSLLTMFKDMNTELPATTKFVIFLSETLQHNALALVGVVGVVIALCVYGMRQPRVLVAFDKLLTKLPVIKNIVIEMNTARTARTLSSLLASGVPLVRSIEITGEVLQNEVFKTVLRKSQTDVVKGTPFSVTIRQYGAIYPPMFQEMAEVGEETGNVAQMLTDIAVFYEDEVDQKTKDLSTIVEPLLMVFIGGAVGFFAISMITPMYSVLSNF